MLAQRLRKIGNVPLELVHGALELALVGFIVREKPVQQRRNRHRLAQRKFACLRAVLVKHSDLRIFENRIARRIPGLEFLLDLRAQLVGGVLRLPPAARQPELVAHRSIGHHALAAGVSGKLRHQRPAPPACGFVEQVVEGCFEAELVRDALIPEKLDVLEIGFDDGISGG